MKSIQHLKLRVAFEPVFIKGMCEDALCEQLYEDPKKFQAYNLFTQIVGLPIHCNANLIPIRRMAAAYAGHKEEMIGWVLRVSDNYDPPTRPYWAYVMPEWREVGVASTLRKLVAT